MIPVTHAIQVPKSKVPSQVACFMNREKGWVTVWANAFSTQPIQQLNDIDRSGNGHLSQVFCIDEEFRQVHSQSPPDTSKSHGAQQVKQKEPII